MSYTPTTEEVRSYFRGSSDSRGKEFDRWLAEVKAQAWKEGWVSRNDYLSHFENPYLEESA